MFSRNLWALSDLHLSISCPNKDMALFGPNWSNYQEKIESHWRSCIKEEDIVLVLGDLSWAMKWEDALKDLLWIDALPGRKIILKGNHDPWWSSRKKMEASLPSSIKALFTEPIQIENICIGGTRLWDHPSTFCSDWIEWSNKDMPKQEWTDQDEKIFRREMERLNLILKQMPKDSYKIAVTHYPPVHPSLSTNLCSNLFEEFKVNKVLFGHLHNLKKEGPIPFGLKNQIDYILTASDYLQFKPKLILSF